MAVKRLRAAVTVLAYGLAWGCAGKGKAGGGSRGAGRPLPVRVAPVTARDVVYQVHALGSLEPSELVEITAEVSGAVKEVLLNAGDHVGTDTILVRVDPDRYRLEAARAEATHRRAVADWRRAESDLARREELAKDDLVAVEELIRARQESERLAADAAGTLRVVDLLGGYDRSPFDPATSPSMIWLLDRASV